MEGTGTLIVINSINLVILGTMLGVLICLIIKSWE